LLNQWFISSFDHVILNIDICAGGNMSLAKYKPTPKGGGKKAAEIFKATRKKQPSDRLIKIISEVGMPEPESKESSEKEDRVAKDMEI
jgi:hypothetical protein